MAVSYSTGIVKTLEQKFRDLGVLRPFRLTRYEPGTVLTYDAQGVIPAGRTKLTLEILKFVGGGFAGQVYKVRLRDFAVGEEAVPAFAKDGIYALKILIPPSGFAKTIRDLFYGFGFQGPFSLQVNPSAGRAQALWQKFIRRAAKTEFGTEECVADILATLIDPTLGSCGEILEWVEGRLWRFEVDDDLDARRNWSWKRPTPGAGSPEYRAKRAFMGRLVRLMHRLGAVELARQYEWWSMKSQPNALKRLASDPDPEAGLTAVDFKAGMALSPVTPQCPADILLVFRGLARGSLVQFDRGNFRTLDAFIAANPNHFADMAPALEELKRADKVYRDSLPDVTHHHVRLLGGKLRRSIMAAMRESWRIRNMTDAATASTLSRSAVLSAIFLLFPFLALASPVLFVFAFPGPVWWKYPLWLAPLIVVPFLRRLWGRGDLRRHYGRMSTRPRYFFLAVRARIAETLIRWLRKGRISGKKAAALADTPFRFCGHWPLSILPPAVHRFLTDGAYFKERLRAMFVRPLRLLFNAEERERWLLDMIAQGERNGMLMETEARRIASQIKEPYIQKYLKSLAVHMATLFVSETVYVTVAVVYVISHPDLSWQQATLHAGVIVGALNLLPVSPGSLIRGFYVVGLMIKERNFKDYNIAFGVSFLKMLGYLAFPIQMAYRYPDLARFMAGHWATEAVHSVPIFGERGAWLEHFVFDAFYNYPLTIQSRMKRRAERRAKLRSRTWPAGLIALAGAALLAALSYGYFKRTGQTAAMGKIWGVALWIPFLGGVAAARAAGGMAAGKRMFRGALSGGAMGLLYGLYMTVAPGLWSFAGPAVPGPQSVLSFINRPVQFFLEFGIFALVGAFFAETRKVR